MYCCCDESTILHGVCFFSPSPRRVPRPLLSSLRRQIAADTAETVTSSFRLTHACTHTLLREPPPPPVVLQQCFLSLHAGGASRWCCCGRPLCPGATFASWRGGGDVITANGARGGDGGGCFRPGPRCGIGSSRAAAAATAAFVCGVREEWFDRNVRAVQAVTGGPGHDACQGNFPKCWDQASGLVGREEEGTVGDGEGAGGGEGGSIFFLF